ncbi:class I SAM-dependent methyltransferase [Methanomassiliicoccus luminyensis]|uniref:class I SAM-dependent methyltransferase n=1 Tax=Methanomassiliicoccus luminyensis TaxID=1080712 RepID=UPI0003796DEC|nr:class I SAM-dependent methyltransferase [Methanomassiliicoccus luminyensis]
MNGRPPASHPFSGEGFSYEKTLRFWDGIADSYSSVQQGTMVDEIVEHLRANGTLDRGRTVLELGSGPGTYSLRIAPMVRSVTCLDTSPKMLDRLFSSARELGLHNLKRLQMDFKDYVPKEKHSVVMSALCPGAGSMEFLGRMERCAERSCASISWIENGWDDLCAEVWKALGRNYSFDSRRSTATLDNLRTMGRSPQAREFSARIELSLSFDEALLKIANDFQPYGLGPELDPAIRKVLEPMTDDGTVHYARTNRLRLVTWNL